MHLGVDGSFWGGSERGVAVSTRRLWSAFLQFSTESRVTVFAPAECAAQLPRASLIPVGPFSSLARIAWQNFVLPRRVDHEAIELLHCPCYTIPTSLSCKAIVTVHDLIARTHPRLVGWRNAAHLRLRLRRGIDRARVVCAPTEFVRRHIIESFNVNPKKVFVVPWGVDLELSPVPREQAVREVERRFNVREPFVLFCGCIEPKKNLQAAIEACNRIGAMLLIVGPTTSGSRSLLPQSDGSTAQRWRYLGYVSSADLSSLYSAAEALVFPSYTEGFGLPTIEAMSMGCPVITSDFPALREVCGGAALHVPCLDANALAGAIRSVITDRSLRESLVGRGLEHSRQFTWRRAVDRFSEALSFAALP